MLGLVWRARGRAPGLQPRDVTAAETTPCTKHPLALFYVHKCVGLF